jgi:hypothetical protein
MATTLTVKANITIFTSGKTEILYETSPGFFVEEADFVQFAKEKRAVLEGEVAKAKTLGKKARIKAFLKKAIGERMVKKAEAKKVAEEPSEEYFRSFSITTLKKMAAMLNRLSKSEDPDDFYTIRYPADITKDKLIDELLKFNSSEATIKQLMEEFPRGAEAKKDAPVSETAEKKKKLKEIVKEAAINAQKVYEENKGKANTLIGKAEEKLRGSRIYPGGGKMVMLTDKEFQTIVSKYYPRDK